MSDRDDGVRPSGGLSRGDGGPSRRRSVAGDDRGVSITVNYVIALAVTAALVSGLLIAGGTMVENQREQVTRDQFDVLGDQLVATYLDADHLVAAGADRVEVRVRLPERVAGGFYDINVSAVSEPADQPNEYDVTLESQAVDVSVSTTLRTTHEVHEKTVPGGPVVIRYVDADGELGRELVIFDDEIDPGFAPQLAGHDEVVFVNDTSGELSSIDTAGRITTYGITNVVAIGPKEYDLDGDGLAEIPYVDDTEDAVKLVDEDGETQTIASDPKESGTILGVGDWRSETSVFYVNASDGDTIWRTSVTEDPQQVAVGGSGVAAKAVVGVADYNGDGDADLVYVGTSSRIWYVDDGDTHDTGRTVGANNNQGAGAPRDFGETNPEVPIIDGSQIAALLTHDNTKTTLMSNGNASKTAVSGIDWDGDGNREVMYVDASSGTLHYVSEGDSETQVTDENGNTVPVDDSVGVA